MNVVISLLVFLIVMGVVWWAATRLIAAFGIPEPVATVILVVIVLLMVLAVLDFTGILASGTLHFSR